MKVKESFLQRFKFYQNIDFMLFISFIINIEHLTKEIILDFHKSLETKRRAHTG